MAGQDEEEPQTWNLYAYTSNNPLNRHDPDGRRWFYKQEGKKITDVQWVNANDDGTYTSPGEGYTEFIPTTERPSLFAINQKGTVGYFFGETADGGPRVTGYATGKVEDATMGLVLDYILAKGIGEIDGSAFNTWRAYRAVRAAEGAVSTVDDILKGAAKGKSSSSRQFSKPGGINQANKDFDALTRNSNVTQRSGSVRTAELKDGTKVNVRPQSSTGKPTIEIQPPKGQGRPIKVRYD